jgi:hypothetical protein
MLKKISQYFLKNKNLLVLLIAIFLYLSITLPAVFDTNHVMKNLEPYPDGLLFSLSARNLSLGRGLGLITAWAKVPFWVPPLYTWYLTVFYLISSNVISFYIANLILGLGTILSIYLIIKKTNNNFISFVSAFAVYFSHLVVFWIPGLAMTENLSMLLFSLLILGLVEAEFKSKLFYFFIASTGLLLVRFSIFPILLSALLILIFQLKNKFMIYSKQIALLLMVPMLVGGYLFQNGIIKTLSSTISTAVFNPIFFNLKFVYPNLIKYLNSLFFHQGYFLWIKVGVSSWPIVGLFSYSIYKLYKLKKLNKVYLLIILFLSLFPLQLFFYTVDARYLIYSIIIFSLAIAWMMNEVKNKKIIFFLFTAIVVNIFYQKNLFKQIIADNWLGRSTAWQYESIQHFNKNLTDNEMIITALPPFLIDTYQTKKYRTLPLSQSQEFLQKKEFVWGEDVNHIDLITGYKEWLEQDKQLYISNAYITHQQSVILDFENFKKEFNLKLVSEGCLQACNIYKLELKND